VAAGHRVIVNEAYLWFAPNAPRVPGADIVVSFHKFVGVGGRVGWVHSDSFFAEARPEIVGTTPPRVWQRAWALLAAEGALRSLSEWVVGRTRAATAEFLREVREHHRDFPSITGPHVLLPLVPGCDEKTALSRFEQHGYRLTAGSHFRTPFAAVRATFTDVPAELAGEFGRFAAKCGLTVMS
jgi:DNA-binding transcriptional MocR family regulator